MVRFLRMGLVFTLVVVVLYLAAMVVLCRVELKGHPLVYRTGDYYHLKGGTAYEKFREWDPGARYDLLVIGSSHAFRGYDPRVFRRQGLSLFNLGSSAQTPLQSYHMLKAYAPPGSARLVMIDVYEGSLVNDGIESTSELVANIGSDRAACEMAGSLRDLRALNMLAVRFMRSGDPPDIPARGYVEGGFSERVDSLKGPVSYPRFRRDAVRPELLERLAACLALCQERDLPVVLVSHPMPHASDSLGHVAFAALIDSVRAPYQVPYIDMAVGHELDDRDHFYDHNHLNQAGVERFNAMLIHALDSAGLLHRHRGAP